MVKKIGIIGTGQVGQALAKGFKKHGYEVAIGSRDGHSINGWKGKVGTSSDVAKEADIVVIAVKGTTAEEVVKNLSSQLKGKIVIDVTNPLADKPPQNGVLQFFTNLNESLMERLQNRAPGAHFVKAFNSIGSILMVNPDFKGVRPTMFICGNNENAKKEVAAILDQFGFEVEDMGKVEAARAIEPLCMLWCIPGFLRNDWTHAFKLLKK